MAFVEAETTTSWQPIGDQSPISGCRYQSQSDLRLIGALLATDQPLLENLCN